MRLPLFVALPALLAVPVAAFDGDAYREVESHGTWTVLCDYEEDMGHTTYFACALQSGAPVNLLFDAVGSGEVTAYVERNFAATQITAPDIDLALTPCTTGDWCAIPGDGAALLEAALGDQPVLVTGAIGLRRLSLGGLAEAVAAVEELVE